MKFEVKNISGENIVNLMRKVGYHYQRKDDEKAELIFTRPLLGVPYPRFHIYLKEDRQTEEISINLHIDQKKPIYEATIAHSGEYQGEVVEKEVARIKKALNNMIK